MMLVSIYDFHVQSQSAHWWIYWEVCVCFSRSFLVWSCQTSNLPKRWSLRRCVTYWCSSCTAARCSRPRFPSPTSWTVRTGTRYDALLQRHWENMMLNESGVVSLCLMIPMCLRSAVWLMLSFSQSHHVIMWWCLWLAEEGAALGAGEAQEPHPRDGQRGSEQPGDARQPLHRPSDRGPADGVRHGRPALPHAHVQRLGARAQGESRCTASCAEIKQ